MGQFLRLINVLGWCDPGIPHCVKANPFINNLSQELPWLKLHSLELSEHPENIELYFAVAKQMNISRVSVPAFIFCGNINFGFDSAITTGEFLKTNLEACYEHSKTLPKKNSTALPELQAEPPLSIPFIGEFQPDNYSLPVFTLAIALVDSFNPCAFFVLLLLLSLLTHTQSRNRMLLIGSVFVFVSGMIYFLFMTAWLNMFLLFGNMRYVTLAAGLIASTIAVINIKDFFMFKKGISLSIPEIAKPKLFQRMRSLVNAENTTTILAGTIMLAIFANTYELLCTAGFPMVYTRHLTLLNLNSVEHYSYLILYNMIYILPLSIIVIVFAYTLGSRKLAETEGKLLKLISGLMMLGLGLLLTFNPDALNNIIVAMSLILFSIIAAWIILRFKAI